MKNRQDYTKLYNENLNLHKIVRGVTQSLSLWPVLFLLYINEMPLVTKFHIILFADNTFLKTNCRLIAQKKLSINKQNTT